MFNKEYVMQLGNELISDTEDIKDCERFFNGVLIYKENVLVMRIGQNKLGEMAYFIKKANCNKMFFGVNGYVQLMDREYELMFNKKEIKNLAVFGFLYVKIKMLMKKYTMCIKIKKLLLKIIIIMKQMNNKSMKKLMKMMMNIKKIKRKKIIIYKIK